MKLRDIYGVGPELKMTRSDLARAEKEIRGWLDGGPIDPDVAHYIGMLIMALAERVPEDPHQMGPGG